MREIIYKKQFKKDFQAILKTGRNLERFAEAVTMLQQSDSLPAHFRDHSLIGNLKSFRECHLAGDLLLIYQTTDTELILVRMGIILLKDGSTKVELRGAHHKGTDKIPSNKGTDKLSTPRENNPLEIEGK